MPSAPPSTNTAAGIATITAIAALGNPRALSGTKTVALDAQIYVGSPSCESLMGSLRFFNASDLAFEQQNVLYLIYATFAVVENGVDQLSASEYNFVGDLQWLIPLGASNDCEDFHIDPCQRAYVHVSGAAANVNQESGTFTLDVDHYISAFKDLKDSNSKAIKPIAPISCEFSARYQNRKKPVPFNRRYVSISGFLTNVTYKPNSEGVVERFTVSIDHIAFLGQQANSTTIPNTLDAPSKTPRSGKNLIDYKRSRATTPSTTSSPAMPSTPDTPTPTQGPPRKRPRIETQSSHSSDSDMYICPRIN